MLESVTYGNAPRMRFPKVRVMSANEHYDIVVLSSGEPGKYLAWALAKAGHRTAVINNYRTSGAELILGEGRFIAPQTIEVQLRDGGKRRLVGESVFLDIGTTATIPDIAGLDIDAAHARRGARSRLRSRSSYLSSNGTVLPIRRARVD